MKKPDINVEAIKKWGIEHGEKVALGLAGVFLLVFLWGVLTAERFDRSRDELASATDKAKKNLQSQNSWTNNPDRESFQTVPYDELAKAQTAPLEVAGKGYDYRWGVAMFEPLQVGPGRAEEPTFLAAVEPVATASRGAFEIAQAADEPRDTKRRNDGGDDQPARRKAPKAEGFRWVAVRAVIPVGQQRTEYIRALKVRQAPTSQVEPDYRTAVLQRRELATSGTWSDWQDVDLRANLNVFERINYAPRPSSPLASPLPTRADGDWDEHDIGHPRLQKTDATASNALQASESEELVVEEPEADTAGSLFGPLSRSRGQTKKPAKTPQGRNTVAASSAARNRNPRAAQRDAEDLFRLFDFTVKPGQCYQYRVKLVLKNPNYGKSPREVQPLRSAERQPYEGMERETDWSVATSPVCVPPDVTYYLDRFVDSRNGPGSAQIVCVRWSEDDGDFESREIGVNAGQVIASKGKPEITTREFVVDLTGGERQLPQVSDFAEVLPAEMLVVNESGEMVVRTERADRPSLESVRQRLAKARNRDRGRTTDDTGSGSATDFSNLSGGSKQ